MRIERRQSRATESKDQAIADYNEAIQRLPENGHGYLWRGEAKRFNQDDPDSSIADFSEAIRLAIRN